MAFFVFDYENGVSPVGDFFVGDYEADAVPALGSGTGQAQPATASGTGGVSGFVSDTFDGTGALGAHWDVFQASDVPDIARVAGRFQGSIGVGENVGNSTEWFNDLVGRLDSQVVAFPLTGAAPKVFLFTRVGVSPLDLPLQNIIPNGGYAFCGIMVRGILTTDYQFAVIGPRAGTITVETKSTTGITSSVLDEGPNPFGAGVSHGDIRVRLFDDGVVEFAHSVVGADTWTLINGTGLTPAGNRPTYTGNGQEINLGMIIYAEGDTELPFTGSIDSAVLQTVTTHNGSGTSIAQDAAGTGTGNRAPIGSGTVTAQTATAIGTGQNTKTGTGVGISSPSTAVGTGTRHPTGIGTVISQNAIATGTGNRIILGLGTGQAQEATAAGTGSVNTVYSIIADLSLEFTIAGTFSLYSTASSGSGTATAQSVTAVGTGKRRVIGLGAGTAQTITVTGIGNRVPTGNGTAISASSTGAGSGTVGNIITGSGTAVAEPSTGVGTGKRRIIGSGVGIAQSSTAVGFGVDLGRGTGQAVAATGIGIGHRVIIGSGSAIAQSATATYTLAYIPSVGPRSVSIKNNIKTISITTSLN